jgi:hypothetical protein
MHGPSNHKSVRRDDPHARSGHRIGAQVHAVSPGRHGDVRPIIHHDGCLRAIDCRQHPADKSQQRRIRQIRLAHLHEIHARSRSPRHTVKQFGRGSIVELRDARRDQADRRARKPARHSPVGVKSRSR